MDINWTDEIPGSVQGTPVNRLRLMGMQGYFPGTTNISKVSDNETLVSETSGEGSTTTNIIKNSDGSTTVTRRFVATDGKTITKVTQIQRSAQGVVVTETVE